MEKQDHHIPASLHALGWTTALQSQLGLEDAGLEPMRVSAVHRSKMTAVSVDGQAKLSLPAAMTTADFAVGDWVLADPHSYQLSRRLDRHSLLQRQTVGARQLQLIAANVDTVFIVTSCNDDFNPARLERYLALTNEAGTGAVIVLTKVDQTPDAAKFQREAAALQRGLPVVSINGKSQDAIAALAPWCGAGQTVALIGSSGVGKSTLLNTLAQKSKDEAQATGGIRADDAKGRHTTTSRSLHTIEGGAWVIDTPGMRTLHVSDLSAGLDELFAEITELAPDCRFRDCTHKHEPGCAVQSAVAAGTLDPARLARWSKLRDENEQNTPVVTGARGNKKMSVRGRRR
ncbi:ribosome small subunit-dependent GTPase A [Tritonibacter scottomollicae]|uniref:Small ribosomal subunit biogenesis GTPase RsgA n=1 Tax=Tritonibacter scottomollicae TaxID=483013 RepID=A0ABZ0HEX2_TRISK|nr:ribosome small subunit-dependent GTPase A [Tritonibacter scottomollicae]